LIKHKVITFSSLYLIIILSPTWGVDFTKLFCQAKICQRTAFGETDPRILNLFHFIFLGGMTIDSTSTGSFFGFSYSGTWKLEKFDSKENSYSLCSFTGKDFCNLFKAFATLDIFAHNISIKRYCDI